MRANGRLLGHWGHTFRRAAGNRVLPALTVLLRCLEVSCCPAADVTFWLHLYYRPRSDDSSQLLKAKAKAKMKPFPFMSWRPEPFCYSNRKQVTAEESALLFLQMPGWVWLKEPCDLEGTLLVHPIAFPSAWPEASCILPVVSGSLFMKFCIRMSHWI